VDDNHARLASATHILVLCPVLLPESINRTSEYCSNTSPDKTLPVSWLYAVKFDAELSEESRAGAVSIMELKLVSELLDCDLARRGRNVRGRRLLADGVAGLDYKPDDTNKGDMVCPPGLTLGGGDCTAYEGVMQLILEQTVNGEAAKQDLLFGIRGTMQKEDFPQVDGIVAVWYLEPELSDVAAIEEDNGSEGSVDAVGAGVSEGAVVAFAALGIFVFGALMLAVYRLRGSTSHADGSLTLEGGGSNATGIDSCGSNPISPFSAMLPKAYMLHDQDTMSAILEGDSDSESRAQSSVFISEGGYTSDGDSHQDSLYATHINPVLGAQKLDDDNLEADREFLFDTSMDLDEVASIDDRVLRTASTGPDDLTVKRGTPTRHL
jgi:hypothetical protein